MEDPNMRDIDEVTLSYTFLYVFARARQDNYGADKTSSRARRDKWGNLVPVEAVPGDAQAALDAHMPITRP